MSQSNGNLSNHKLSLVLLEPTVLDQMSEELTAFNEVHDKEYSKLVLEHVIHADDEWVIDGVKDLFLQLK